MICKHVNIVFVGAGPATLGIMCNAQRTGRLSDLVTKNGGIAIIEQGSSFGGGNLQHFGINSNTSANGFMKFVSHSRPKDDLKSTDVIKLNSTTK